jgi:hypothetical protein
MSRLFVLAVLVAGCEAAAPSTPSGQTNRVEEPWLSAPQQGAIEGDLRLWVSSTRLGGPYEVDEPLPRKGEQYLVIRLRLENLSQERILHYPDWGRFDEAVSDATLKDNLGNTYRPVRRRTKPDNHVRPGQESKDLLVFEEPLRQAKEFFLELPKPGSSLSNLKTFKFRFPRP